jgi:MarR family transcriptional regulator, organic hydroperoxide resistance regulator
LTSTIFARRWNITDKNIINIYNSLQDIAWHFGSHGINGECCGDLSFIDFIALKKIYENSEITIQGLGSAMNFTKSGATRIVNRLEGKDYVERENSPLDGRVCCVRLTEKGSVTISKIIENYSLYLEDVLKGFEPKEVEQIEIALEKLFAAVRRNKPFNSNTVSIIEGECL